ncbi:hypothetical protein DEU34_2232 [Microbacterium sp. AG1240]|uniref:hypothetical protein n=1 Tax=Microbacterium sp. AG1240 TaxID=2183992 RepID=UPI000EAF5CA4|nr:hypothetical protein [Microbacterium sp. AG1240]RKT33629.1 hypothetical protein DEU34_2232 [Microbacterium sp. AG1240]
MDKRARELIDYGALCGFEMTGTDGAGHYRLEHPNGATLSVACTPGDYRGDRNNMALMRKLSGVTPPRARSGKYRRGTRQERFVPAAERVDSVSAQAERLLSRHQELCDQVAYLSAEGDATRCRPVVTELLEVETAIRDLGRPVPLRTFRTN